MPGLFNIFQKPWTHFGYFRTVCNEYASISELGWGDDPGTGIRLDLDGFARQSETEHLLVLFCRECMNLGIPARVCTEIICIFGYCDIEIPRKYVVGEFDRATLAVKWASDQKLLREGEAVDFYGIVALDAAQRKFRPSKKSKPVSQTHAPRSRTGHGESIVSTSIISHSDRTPDKLDGVNAASRSEGAHTPSSGYSCKWRSCAGRLENRATGAVFQIVSSTPEKGEVIREGKGYRFHPSLMYGHIGDWEIEFAR